MSPPARGTRSISTTSSNHERPRRFTGCLRSDAVPTILLDVSTSAPDEVRDGVNLTHLDQVLFEGAGATKRDLVDHLDRVHDVILPELRDRPLSVIRATSGQAPFMQKNLPKYAPEWIQSLPLWAEASQRTVSYALCNDRRTLLWFANQRAIEYHPTLMRAAKLDAVTHLVLDLDPPPGADFAKPVHAAHLIHEVLDGAGLAGAVKTSGAKGLHVFVPIEPATSIEDAAAVTRAIARRAELLDPTATTTAFMKSDRDDKVFLDSTRSGGATVVAVYSPRARPGLPVSFPVAWADLDQIAPSDFTVLNAADLLDGRNPWAEQMPAAQQLPDDLVAEGHAIPAGRVAAMHEGKRRKRAERTT